jgi:hypothetical protein
MASTPKSNPPSPKRPSAASVSKSSAKSKAGAVGAQRRRRIYASSFRADETATLVTYLRNPTSVGFWRLTAARHVNGKFLRYLFEHNKLDLGAYRLQSSPAKTQVVVQSNDEADRPDSVARATTFFSAINAAHLLNEGHDLAELLKADDHGIRNTEYFDVAKVLEKFGDVVALFKETITHANFGSLVARGRCFEVASGTVVLISAWHAPTVTFVAVAQEPLLAIGRLLESAELILEPLVERVFSPEEELLSPYFEFLKVGYDTTIRDQRLRPQLELAFEYFEKEDFTHTISTLGLVAEDYLTQIYESFLRVPCPRGSTLGQIYDQFHQKLKELLAPKQLELAQLDSHYKSLSELQKLPASSASKATDALIASIRDVLNTIKSDRKYFLDRIESSTKQTKRISVFPDWLHDNLMELIRNRNAASHKTRIPLGRFEALRTLYCLSAFSLWWREQKDQTNWALDSLEILKLSVAT